MTKTGLRALALCAALALASPSAVLAEEPPAGEKPGELAREGVERLMQALEAFIQMIPQYEMPIINEEGDIIIRRKRDAEPPPAKKDEDGDVDETRI